MKKVFQKEDGLTLVEILAAITILGIIFIGFLSIFPRMTEINSQTEMKLETMNLARVELNEVKRDKNYLLDTYDKEDKSDLIIFTRTDDELDFVITYDRKDVLKEGAGNESTDFLELYQIHLEIKNGDKLISETFGYLPYEVE